MKWRFSHSNPSIRRNYIPAERREEMWQQIVAGFGGNEAPPSPSPFAVF